VELRCNFRRCKKCRLTSLSLELLRIPISTSQNPRVSSVSLKLLELSLILELDIRSSRLLVSFKKTSEDDPKLHHGLQDCYSLAGTRGQSCQPQSTLDPNSQPYQCLRPSLPLRLVGIHGCFLVVVSRPRLPMLNVITDVFGLKVRFPTTLVAHDQERSWSLPNRHCQL
jgi:hypothetical protein